jgi:hypothetical protein
LVSAATEGYLTITTSWILNQVLDSSLSWEQLVDCVTCEFQRKPIISGAELAYYLQGYFEISLPRRKAINSDTSSHAFSVLQAHKIIKVFEQNVDGMHPILLNFYWNMRKFVVTNTFVSTDIEVLLNGLFLHVIDDSYGYSAEKTAQLQVIHDKYKES